MVKKRKKTKASLSIDAGKATGKSELGHGIKCIGEICFTDEGFKITIPEDANPECARKTAELILRGNSNVVFEVPGKGIVKNKEELEDMLDAEESA